MPTPPQPPKRHVAEHLDRIGEELEMARRRLVHALSDGHLTDEDIAEVSLALAGIDLSEMHDIHVGAKVDPQ